MGKSNNTVISKHGDTQHPERTRYYKTVYGERLHIRKKCATIAHAGDDALTCWKVCWVCLKDEEKRQKHEKDVVTVKTRGAVARHSSLGIFLKRNDGPHWPRRATLPNHLKRTDRRPECQKGARFETVLGHLGI